MDEEMLNSATLGQVNLLLAEDNLINQTVAMSLLNNKGFRVIAVKNGIEALRALELQSFDLILMDVQMPEMDGLEATALIREREKRTGAHIPIIAMTAHAMQDDKEKCLKAGMDGYASKPINTDELFATIKLCLQDHAQHTDNANNSRDIVVQEEDLYDIDSVAGEYLIGLEKVGSIYKLYIEEVQHNLSEITKLVASADWHMAERYVHNIKGVSGNLRILDVYEEATALDDLLKRGFYTNVEIAVQSLSHTFLNARNKIIRAFEIKGIGF
jgi:CheY-like chemotaxis protein/HPt (histidine-containing phosphotransfer) domain-containing protein